MRLSWIDAIKGFAIITVIVGHVAWGYMAANSYPDAIWIKYIVNFVGSFHMPLFFLASGYLYELTWNENPYKKPNRIRNKFMDMFCMYILFSLLYGVPQYLMAPYLQMNMPPTILDLILIPIKPIGHLWFLWVLMILFVLVPLLIKWIRIELLMILFLMGYTLLLYVGGEEFNSLTRIFYGGVYFSFGSWLRERRFDLLQKMFKRSLFCLSVIIAIINCFIYLKGEIIQTLQTIYSIGIALVGSYIVWYIFYEYWDKYMLCGIKFFRLCGEKSLQLYILHMYFVGPMRTICTKLNIDDLVIRFFLATIIGILGPLVIAFVCDQNRCLGYLFHPADLIRNLAHQFER